MFGEKVGKIAAHHDWLVPRLTWVLADFGAVLATVSATPANGSAVLTNRSTALASPRAVLANRVGRRLSLRASNLEPRFTPRPKGGWLAL